MPAIVASVPHTTLPLEIRYTQKWKKALGNNNKRQMSLWRMPNLDPDCGSARYWHAAFRIGGATEVGNFEAAWHIICTVLYSCIEKRRKTFKTGFTSVSFFHGILIQMGFLAVVRHLQILHISLSTFRLVLLLLLQSKKQLDLICFEEENFNLSFPQKSFVFLKNKLEPKEKRRCKIFVICLFPQRRGCWPP